MKHLLFCILPLCAVLFAQNPCEDPRYMELKKKPLDSMTQREFDYYMLKEKYCLEDASKYASTRLCTLAVTIDSAKVDGKDKIFKLFVDDVEMNVVPKKATCTVVPGIHKVSLFSLTEIDDFEKKINRRIMTNENKNFNYGIGVMEAKLHQMKKTVKTISAVAGKRISLHYQFTCDNSKTGKCGEDEWALVPEIN